MDVSEQEAFVIEVIQRHQRQMEAQTLALESINRQLYQLCNMIADLRGEATDEEG